MKKKVLNVLYQSDNNYVVVGAISIVSLLENNKDLDEINIYYCGYKLSKLNVDRLNEVVGRYGNANLNFLKTESYHETFIDLGVRPWHGVYVTWLKMLAIADIPASSDRVLYLNPHTIVNGSLAGILEIDLQGNVMALAYDVLTNHHKKTIGLNWSDGYFNCGVMLFNHKIWLDEGVGDLIKEHLAVKSDYVIADQDLCNVLFRNRIKLLTVNYNFSSAYYAYGPKNLMRVNKLSLPYFYSLEEIMEEYFSPKIIHSLFGVTGKPWEIGNQHPNRALWNKYYRILGWDSSKLPVARKTLTWRLYKLLPVKLFLVLYIIAVKRKFAR